MIVDENVQFSVFRPRVVRPGVSYRLLAFAHLAERRPGSPLSTPDPLEQVRALAEQALGEDAAGNEGPRVDARAGVPQRSQLTFVPYVAGVDFQPRSSTFEWAGEVHQETFRLVAGHAGDRSVLRGRLTVYLGAFILADVDLAIRVDASAALPAAAPGRSFRAAAAREADLEPATGSPYRMIFPSYSHRDMAIVEQAEAFGLMLGDVYLRDRTTLRSGEDWDARLLELMEQADVFQLFWSSNSMTSSYVRREWEHAVALHRPSFIRPTYWETPMPTSVRPMLPPEELRSLHFHCFAPAAAVGNVGRADVATEPSWSDRHPVNQIGPAPSAQPAPALPRSRRSAGPARWWIVLLLFLVAGVVVTLVLR